MIFVGDVSLPFKGAINYNLPEIMLDKNWVINLEGGLVKDASKYVKYNLVVNSVDAIEKISQNHNINIALNNNHILDNGNFKKTETYLKKLDLKYFGAGKNLYEASKPFVNDSEKLVVLGFGWSVIECIYATNKKSGVNPMEFDYVLSEFNKYKTKYSNYNIVCFFHWNYELEKYPMPLHRFMAHKLIDMGCDGIIGLHPHRVQGFELYKNKPIVYSLGNWLFRQKYYRNGKLSFPNFCNLQLAFEFSSDGNHLFHFFDYDSATNQINYIKTENLKKNMLIKKTPFSNLTHLEYDKWFAKNRFQRKIIPIYHSKDSKITINLKNKFNFFRTSFINLLVKYNLK
tara:strand:- start:1371 stop:2399 length:1029 start_codon:yes stop_codon:yes gene_type:complete